MQVREKRQPLTFTGHDPNVTIVTSHPSISRANTLFGEIARLIGVREKASSRLFQAVEQQGGEMMADRISDEAFDAMPLSQQLEFVASHLGDADEASMGNLKCWDISNMLMHALVMSRLEFAFEQAEAPESNVMGWPVIAQNVHINVYGADTPKGAA